MIVAMIRVDEKANVWVNVEAIDVIRPGPVGGSHLKLRCGDGVASPLTVDEVLAQIERVMGAT